MDLPTIRRRLLADIAGLLRRGDKLEGSLRRERTPLEGDWAEDAIVRENDEVIDALDADTRAHVDRLRAAVARIDAGSYGRCATCDEPIGAPRLDALPEVTTCIDCATEAERPRR
jgi:RNA polymerase-binding transcription factor DksA